MIDLGLMKANKKFYEIKLEDNSILHINSPSQKMFVAMMELSKMAEGDPIDQIDKVYDICVDVFNNNTDGRKFTKDELSQMFDFNIAAYVIQDYLQETTKRLGE